MNQAQRTSEFHMGRVEDFWFDTENIPQYIRERLWFRLSEDIGSIVDLFYERLAASGFELLVKTKNLDLLKHKQINHWRHLFTHPIDDDYARRLENMHAQHLRIGLQPHQYIESYFILLSLFQKSLIRRSAGPFEAQQLIAAMNSIVAEDVSRALGSADQND